MSKEKKAAHAAKSEPEAASDSVASEGAASAEGAFKTPKNLSTKAKVLLGFSAFVLLGLVGCYGAGAAYFSSHFYPNTYYSNKDYSLCTTGEFVSDVVASVPNYELAVTGPGFAETITALEVNLKISASQLKTNALESQNVWLWPIEALAQHDLANTVKTEFDHKKVKEAVAPKVEAYNKNAKAPVNATIAYEARADAVMVQEEIYGQQLRLPDFVDQIEARISHLEPTYTIDQASCLQPEILSTDPRLAAALSTAQKLTAKNIELTMAKNTVSAGRVSKELIASWFVYDPETLAPSLDKKKVEEWVAKKSTELNTVGTVRKFTRGDGKVVTASGGVYGWKVDTANLANTIFDQLNAEKFETIDIPCGQTADVYNGPGGVDWGPYVSIDITEQKVRYFNEKNELQFESDCVTGNVSNKSGTPLGLYYLRMKKSPETLMGLREDGSLDYETKVDYWLPFIKNSIGLHDANWRARFGGKIYKSNGSHGCVNLPTEAAKWFYENLNVNVAVIVHE